MREAPRQLAGPGCIWPRGPPGTNWPPGHSHHLTSGRGDKAGMVSPLRFAVILAPPPISCVALSQSLLLSET